MLYFIDPKYMLCIGKYKEVSKSFKKAVEIVFRVSLNQCTRLIEKHAVLIEKERELWYKSAKVVHLRNVIKDLHNSSMKRKNESHALEAFPDGFRDDKKAFVLVMVAGAWAGMDESTYD